MVKKQTSEKLLLIDANSLIHRAYHALPPLTGPGGNPTGALHGLGSILFKLFDKHEPDYAAAAFDRPEPSFRKLEYKEYKAHRPPTPSDLITQLGEAPNLFESFGIKTLDVKSYEADDVVAALAHKFKGDVEEVIIVSGDLDILQIVDGGRVVVEVPGRGVGETKTYDKSAVLERFGVSPEQLIDYKGLVGDSSDNIPGVRGVGPKSATALIQKEGSIEKIYKNINSIEKESKSLAKKLKSGQESAMVSKKLATIVVDIPLSVTLSELKFEDYNNNKDLVDYLDRGGFKSLLKRLGGGDDKEESKMGKLF